MPLLQRPSFSKADWATRSDENIHARPQTYINKSKNNGDWKRERRSDGRSNVIGGKKMSEGRIRKANALTRKRWAAVRIKSWGLDVSMVEAC